MVLRVHSARYVLAHLQPQRTASAQLAIALGLVVITFAITVSEVMKEDTVKGKSGFSVHKLEALCHDLCGFL